MENKIRPQLSWALYDWANSAFVTTIISGFFPIFFKEYWGYSIKSTESTFYLGTANSTAAILVAILAPFLGAVADKGSAKKRMLATFALLGILMTSCLFIVQSGLWQYAILLYLFATISWSGANVFYDALLPTVAKKKEVDFVSSLGYALGYIGGGLLFLFNVILFLKYDYFGLSNEAVAVKINFISVAVWWAIFSIPLLIYVKEPKFGDTLRFKGAIFFGWKQLIQTIRNIKNYRIVVVFLFAYWLYIDGVDTIVRMAVDYGKSLHFSNSTLITALLMVQFVAFPAALAYSWIAAKIGTKNAVLSGIFGYILITFFGYFMAKEWHFYTLAGMVGLFQGGIQALSRSLYTRIIPLDKSAEFFGFYNMLGKFAAVLGPLMMGTVTLWSGSARFGILSILILFISGAIILWQVDIAEGEKLARTDSTS
jgi:UMF1 family MFS transporter